jgi:putative ABC transport system permease protein
MRLHDIALASIRRRKTRFAFVFGVIGLGVATIVALTALARTMQVDVGDELDRFGANILITPKSDVYDLSYGALSLGGLSVTDRELTRGDADAVLTIHHRRNIRLVSPKLVGVATVEEARVLLVGTDVAQEPLLKPWWRITGAVPGSEHEALVGSEVAATLGVVPGAELAIGSESLHVAGVLAPTGSIDDRAIFSDLTVAERVLDRLGAISLIEVSALCRGCPIEDIVMQISAAIPHARVAPVRQAVAAREKAVGQLTRFSYAIAVLLVAAGALVVATTAMASVAERTQEIGILRAVGFRRSQVAAVILMETMLVTALGGLTGWAAGVAAARTLGPQLVQTASVIAIEPRLAVAAIVCAVLVGVAGGAYPAARAAAMDPSAALRQF